MKFEQGSVQLKNVAIFGAPVFVHWSAFVAMAGLALIALANPIYAALFVACYFTMIFVHEVGHALIAHRLGYRVHLISMTFWHGKCETEAPDTEWEAALIAWGGFIAQLAVAVPALLVMFSLGSRDWGYWTPLIVILGYMNVVIAVSNLLPGDELDGEVAWRVVPIFLQMRRENRSKRVEQASRSSRR